MTTYYNKGDLGIGREMLCINNGCNLELACYVMNFGKRDGTASHNARSARFMDFGSPLSHPEGDR